MKQKAKKICFYTEGSWKANNSQVPNSDTLDLTISEWDYVGFEFQAYYFHVHLNSKCMDKNILKEFRLCLRIEFALEILRFNRDSALTIMVPGWISRSKPALYEVAAIYISTEPGVKTYIAECTNKKLYALHLDPEPRNIKLSKIKKELLWHKCFEISPLRIL